MSPRPGAKAPCEPNATEQHAQGHMQQANGDQLHATSTVVEEHAGFSSRTSKRRAAASKPRSFYGYEEDDAHGTKGAGEHDSEAAGYDSEYEGQARGKSKKTAGKAAVSKRPRKAAADAEGCSSEDAAMEQQHAAIKPQPADMPVGVRSLEQGVALAAGMPGLAPTEAKPQLTDDASKPEQPAEAEGAGPQVEAVLGTDGQPLPIEGQLPPGMTLPDFMLGCYRCRFAPAGCLSCRTKPFLHRPYARWTPSEARAQKGVPLAPTYYPTAEEFKDPLKYISSVHPEASKYGICRIVPPAGWSPPCMVSGVEKGGKGGDCFRFYTRKQFTSHLCMRAPSTAATSDAPGGGGSRMGRMCMMEMADPSHPNAVQQMAGVFAARMDHVMASSGGAAPNAATSPSSALKAEGGNAAEAGGPGPSSGAAAKSCSPGSEAGSMDADGGKGSKARGSAKRASVGRMGAVSAGKVTGSKASQVKSKRVDAGSASRMGDLGCGDEDEDGFGFLSSERMHTLKSFQAYAKWAKATHFGLPLGRPRAATAAAPAGHAATPASGGLGVAQGRVTKKPPAKSAKGPREPTVDELESEFWRLVERPQTGQVVETLYGSDLDSGKYGSGFPLPEWRPPPTDQRASAGVPATDEAGLRYVTHPWNINNMPRAPASVLRYIGTDELITGVMVPWLYIGSCMSAFCWHIEDHALYSINYLHTGAAKVWYGVPAHASAKLEAAMRDCLPHLFVEDPLLLHRLVTMVSPKELMARGVPVYKLVHEERSFVITFPNAYHAGFNTGFNLAEAVNFAPAEWLPYGTDVVKKYRTQKKSTTLSHDQLVHSLVAAAPIVAEKQARDIASGSVHWEQGSGDGPTECGASTPSPSRPAGQAVTGDGVIYTADGGKQYSWRAGIKPENVPVRSLLIAAGEFAVRLDEERQRRDAAVQQGVSSTRPMQGTTKAQDASGVFVNTHDTDCEECKCDLFMSAVVSNAKPGVAYCPNHASMLGVPASQCTLLYRHSLDELQALLDTALRLFPGAQEYVDAARTRVATPPDDVIKPLGPLVEFSQPGAADAAEVAAADADAARGGEGGGADGTPILLPSSGAVGSAAMLSGMPPPGIGASSMAGSIALSMQSMAALPTDPAQLAEMLRNGTLPLTGGMPNNGLMAMPGMNSLLNGPHMAGMHSMPMQNGPMGFMHGHGHMPHFMDGVPVPQPAWSGPQPLACSGPPMLPPLSTFHHHQHMAAASHTASAAAATQAQPEPQPEQKNVHEPVLQPPVPAGAKQGSHMRSAADGMHEGRGSRAAADAAGAAAALQQTGAPGMQDMQSLQQGPAVQQAASGQHEQPPAKGVSGSGATGGSEAAAAPPSTTRAAAAAASTAPANTDMGRSDEEAEDHAPGRRGKRGTGQTGRAAASKGRDNVKAEASDAEDAAEHASDADTGTATEEAWKGDVSAKGKADSVKSEQQVAPQPSLSDGRAPSSRAAARAADGKRALILAELMPGRARKQHAQQAAELELQAQVVEMQHAEVAQGEKLKQEAEQDTSHGPKTSSQSKAAPPASRPGAAVAAAEAGAQATRPPSQRAAAARAKVFQQEVLASTDDESEEQELKAVERGTRSRNARVSNVSQVAEISPISAALMDPAAGLRRGSRAIKPSTRLADTVTLAGTPLLLLRKETTAGPSTAQGRAAAAAAAAAKADGSDEDEDEAAERSGSFGSEEEEAGSDEGEEASDEEFELGGDSDGARGRRAQGGVSKGSGDEPTTSLQSRPVRKRKQALGDDMYVYGTKVKAAKVAPYSAGSGVKVRSTTTSQDGTGGGKRMSHTGSAGAGAGTGSAGGTAPRLSGVMSVPTVAAAIGPPHLRMPYFPPAVGPAVPAVAAMPVISGGLSVAPPPAAHMAMPMQMAMPHAQAGGGYNMLPSVAPLQLMPNVGPLGHMTQMTQAQAQAAAASAVAAGQAQGMFPGGPGQGPGLPGCLAGWPSYTASNPGLLQALIAQQQQPGGGLQGAMFGALLQSAGLTRLPQAQPTLLPPQPSAGASATAASEPQPSNSAAQGQAPQVAAPIKPMQPALQLGLSLGSSSSAPSLPLMALSQPAAAKPEQATQQGPPAEPCAPLQAPTMDLSSGGLSNNNNSTQYSLSAALAAVPQAPVPSVLSSSSLAALPLHMAAAPAGPPVATESSIPASPNGAAASCAMHAAMGAQAETFAAAGQRPASPQPGAEAQLAAEADVFLAALPAPMATAVAEAAPPTEAAVAFLPSPPQDVAGSSAASPYPASASAAGQGSAAGHVVLTPAWDAAPSSAPASVLPQEVQQIQPMHAAELQQQQRQEVEVMHEAELHQLQQEQEVAMVHEAGLDQLQQEHEVAVVHEAELQQQQQQQQHVEGTHGDHMPDVSFMQLTEPALQPTVHPAPVHPAAAAPVQPKALVSPSPPVLISNESVQPAAAEVPVHASEKGVSLSPSLQVVPEANDESAGYLAVQAPVEAEAVAMQVEQPSISAMQEQARSPSSSQAQQQQQQQQSADANVSMEQPVVHVEAAMLPQAVVEAVPSMAPSPAARAPMSPVAVPLPVVVQDSMMGSNDGDAGGGDWELDDLVDLDL